MPNTLGLDDDLDPVEVVVDLEKAFALKISDDEATACETVGDIYDLLHSRFAAQIGSGGACMTSMAFYRLRKTLRLMHPAVDFRPGTPLASFAGSNARAFLDQLQNGSGLRIPGPQGRWLSTVGCLLSFSAFAAVVIAAVIQTPAWFLAAIGLVLVGVALMRLDPGGLPDDCATLGELARKAEALNYGSFARSGGSVRADGLWDAMAEVLSGRSDLPKADMRRDTLILQKQLGDPG